MLFPQIVQFSLKLFFSKRFYHQCVQAKLKLHAQNAFTFTGKQVLSMMSSCQILFTAFDFRIVKVYIKTSNIWNISRPSSAVNCYLELHLV